MFAVAPAPSSHRTAGFIAALAIGFAALFGFAAPASAVSFGTSAAYNDGGDPLGVAVGDFNEDGSTDVVAANDSNSTSLMLNNGSGAFSLASPGWPAPAGSGSGSLVVGDFNEDDHADIATANRNADTVTIQLGDGAGGLLSTSSFSLDGGSQPFFIAKGDFDEDGHQDLVTANQNSGNVSLLLGDGTGVFAKASGSPFTVGSTPRGVAVGDVDEDGHQDIVTANQGTDEVAVMLGDGSGGLAAASGSPYPVSDAPRQVTLGDFNNDDHLDFATANSGEPTVGNNKVSVYLGDGSGAFTQATNSPFVAGNWPFSIDTGDFDGDGNLDIVTANRFPTGGRDDMSVLIGNGNGGFAAPFSVRSPSSGLAPTAVAVADFNNDDKPDVVMNEAFGPTIVVALNTTTPSTPTITDSDPDSPSSNNPSIKGTAAAGTTVHLYTTSDCSGTEVTSGSAAAFASPGFSVSVPDNSSTTFYAVVTNQAGWRSACSSGFTYVEDSTAPAAPTTLGTTPASPGHTRTPLVTGTAEAGSTVKIYKSSDCSGSQAATGTPSQFASGISVTVTRNATTPLSATATDAAGNTSPCSSSIDYTEAGTPVPTGLDTSPGSPGRDTSPRIIGTAEDGSTVKLYTTSDCSGSPVATGSSTDFGSPGISVSVPTGATRTFRATATDGDGNVSPCSDPVSYTQEDSGTSTYFVRTGGTGSACTQAHPCGTIADALVSHRLSPTTNDVIDVGAGTFVGTVDASDPADDGLTIRGTLGAGGSRDTTIRSDGSTPCPGSFGICGVELGVSPDVAVTLKDANVDTVGNSSSVRPVGVAGGSDLTNVSVSSQPSGTPGDIVKLGDDPGTTIDNSTIDASGTFANGINTEQAGFAITDSHVIADGGSGIENDSGPPSNKVTVTRTWLEADPNGFSYGISSAGDVTLDSSLITGGEYGLYFYGDGNAGHQLQVQNSTIDVGQPGQGDSGDDGYAGLYIDFSSGDPTPDDVTVAGSILADDIQTYAGGAAGSFTCNHSDLQGVQIDPLVTDDCAGGSNGNTSTDPANQFVGGSPFSWQLKSGAPAIDAGQPGAVDPAFSQTDLAGNPRRAPGLSANCPDGVVDMGGYERLALPCDAPSIDSSSPSSPANDNNPKLLGSATAGTTVALYDSSNCSGSPVATGSASSFNSPGITVTVADNTATTFTADATNASGTSPCSSGFTYTEDSTPPNAPSITSSSPPSPANNNSPKLLGTAAAGSTVKLYKTSNCSGPPAAIDSAGSFQGSGVAVTVADDSSTTFKATATDAVGNTSACSSGFTYTEDSTAPTASVDFGPTGPTNNPRPTFGFSSNDGGATFACSIDDGTPNFRPCSGASTDRPASNLADGDYTFRVRATDQAGNSGTATRDFSVDTATPNTTITVGPANGAHIKDPTPTFRFSSNEAGSTFKCQVDSGAYASCSSPKTTAKLTDGSHTFSVKATDDAGNTDATPASRQFTVDTKPPQTTITSGPVSGNTRDRTPTFQFKSSEPGSSFACSLDRAAFKPCESPLTTPKLAFGNHTLDVRATDRAGNTDPTPAQAAFRVVR